MSSGFAELGGEGRERQAQIVELVHRHGLTLLGPNTLGIFNFHTGTHMSFGTVLGEHDSRNVPVGSAALVTQSGAVGSYLCAMARPRVPFRYMVSTGNEATSTSADFVVHLAADPEVTVIALCVEGIGDGAAFIDAVAAAVAAGKHVVILPAAESSASARAASSHTAALTSSNQLTRVLAAEAGAFVADTPEQLLGTVIALQRHGGADRRGVGVVSVSGGAGVIVADRLAAAGLEVSALNAQTIARLRSALPYYATPGNPADTTAAAIYQPDILTSALQALATDPGIGQVLTIMGAGGERSGELARALVTADAEIDVPHQVVWLACPQEAKDGLAEGDLSVSPGIADAVGVAKTLYRQSSARPADTPPPTPAALPEVPAGDADGFVAESQSRNWLRAAGLPLTPTAFLPGDYSDSDVDRLELDFPVAVKIQARGVHHKTEIGGVVLDVRDHAELHKALADTHTSAHRHLPDVHIEGWDIAPMAPRGVEVLVDVRVDPSFGPVVTVGAGGVTTELIADVSTARAPVTRDQVYALLSRTRIGTVLNRFRGRTTDLNPLCDFVRRLSELITVNTTIREIECNPVIVTDDGRVQVVDSLLRVRATDATDSLERTPYR